MSPSQRILVTGMGGELGARVTNLLEAQGDIERVVGMDIDPPRRRLTRAEFHRIDPRHRGRAEAVVRELDPHAVVHLGVYEPNARSYPSAARSDTATAATAVLGAASGCPSLDRIIVRSGIEIYGRGRGAATRPDESVPPGPTSDFGRSVQLVEQVAARAGRMADVPVTCLRFAPIVGPHFPSPLGRYLRMPLVPVSAISDLPFSVVHQEDAARAIVAALDAGWHGPLNVVGRGAVTAVQACRLGGRIPVPIIGPVWRLARGVAELAGAPVPDHVKELLVRGRTADGGLLPDLLGLPAARSTPDVVKELYDWAPVTILDIRDHVA